MSKTISSVINGGVTLTALADDPATVTSSGAVTGGITVNYAGLSILNQGQIGNTTLGGSGITFSNGGTITNQGSIGAYYGILGLKYGAPVTVVNSGTISAFSTGSVEPGGGIFNLGMYLQNGGAVTNTSGALISGHKAIYAAYGALSLVNAGTITGTGPTSLGVRLFTGGTVSNISTGTISGGTAVSGTGVTVVNAGQITGTGAGSTGVYLQGGAVTNNSGGVISGTYGVSASVAGVTVVNAGQITGTSDAVIFAAGTGNQLTVDPGASFSGAVNGGNPMTGTTVSTLYLASTPTPTPTLGTLSALGTTITNFGSIAFQTGSEWFVEGNTTGLSGTITGFAAGDTIELDGITATGSNYANGVLTLNEASGSATLNITGASSHFVVTATGGNTSITLACFVTGTAIRTPGGDRAIEDLRAGDLVETIIGGGPGEVVWIGHRTIDCRRHPSPELVWPVRVAAGAFGEGMPARDLSLSPDHAVFVQDKLIPIKQLMNGATIVQEKRDRVTYYHLELARHDVLLAEGLPAESYLDTGNRAVFENADPGMILHPDMSGDSGQARRDTGSCVPFVCEPASVEPVWLALVTRAAAMGHPVPEISPMDDRKPGLLLDGRLIKPFSGQGGLYRFVVPQGVAKGLRLVSHHAAPTDAKPWLTDTRRLGIAVQRITVRTASQNLDVAMDDPCLASGWWDAEGTGAHSWRWTNGDAALPPINGPAIVEVRVAQTLVPRELAMAA